MVQSAEWWLSQIGAGYNPDDPFAQAYEMVCERNQPSGAESDFIPACEANLRYRGLIYWKETPGDCGTAAARGTVLSTSSVSATTSIEKTGIEGLSAIPVIGGILSGIFGGIFAEHEQAVQNEQANICSVARAASAAIPQIDAQVISGKLSLAQGVAAMQTVCGQLIAQLATTNTSSGCDASCYYQGYLKAHIDFAANFYYPAIAGGTSQNSKYVIAAVIGILILYLLGAF